MTGPGECCYKAPVEWTDVSPEGAQRRISSEPLLTHPRLLEQLDAPSAGAVEGQRQYACSLVPLIHMRLDPLLTRVLCGVVLCDPSPLLSNPTFTRPNHSVC